MPPSQQTSCHSIDLSPQDGRAPEWVHLLPLGVFAGRDGRGPYRVADGQAATAIVAATKAFLGGADMVIDYNHQAYLVARTGGPSPASGWITEFDLRDTGIWGRVSWTQDAAEAIAKREYRYLSPVFNHTPQGDVTMVRCAGLSNLPNLELTALACQQASPLEEIPMANDAKTGDAAKDNASAGAPAEPDTTLASLRTTFGLPADADGAAIAAHAQELMAKAVQPAQPPAPPDPARYVPMEAFAALQSQVADMVKQSQTSAAQAAVQAATEAGKLPPAMHSWAQGYAEQNLAGFTAWAASAPVLVSAHAQGVGGQTATPPASTPGLTAEQTAVCAQLGLSAEAFSQQLGGDR